MARREEARLSRFEDAGASPGFVLWQVATLWQRHLRAALEEVGLTHAQFVMLASAAWLARPDGRAPGGREEPVSQARIAEHARTDAVMTSEVLRTLERKGLVQRLPHPGDARARSIVLTEAGQSTVRRAMALVEEADAAFFGAPGPELRALGRLLRQQEDGWSGQAGG
jgi:DNA-binding MarR family transcriptional regulator